MHKIIVTSKNPVKLIAAEAGFVGMFPELDPIFMPISVPSGVSEQPMSDEETLQGAIHRARKGQEAEPDAEFWIGIEGGVESRPSGLYAAAWVAVLARRNPTLIGRGKTASFQLPPEIAEMVRGGMELGPADDRFFRQTNSKQKMGAVGLLTNNLIDRAGLYTPAVSLALIPFRHPNWYLVTP